MTIGLKAKWPEYLSLSLLAAMWLLPFPQFDNKLPIVTYHGEWLAMFLGLLAGLPTVFRKKLKLPRIALLPLSIAAILGIQLLFLPQVIKQHAQIGMAYLLWAVLVMTVAYNLLRTIDLTTIVPVLAGSLLLGALIVSCLEVWARFGLGFVGFWGGTSQANSYSDYLSLGLASALYLEARQHKVRPWFTIGLAVSTGILVAALSLSTSRSIWLYFLALAILVQVSGLQQKRLLLTRLGIAALLYALMQLVWAMGWLPTIQIQSSGERIQSSGESFVQEVGGAPIRLHVWKVAWQLFLQAPWLGQGFGQFDWAYFAAGDALPEVPNRLEHAHNLILHLLAEMGMFPVLVLLMVLGLWLYDLLKTKLSVESWWVLALLAVLGLHSMLEYPLWYSYFLGIAAVLLGLGEQKSYELSLGQAGKWSGSLAVLALVLLCINHRNGYMRMENMMDKIEHGRSKPTMTEFVAVMKQVSQDTPSLAPYIAVVFTIIDKSNEKPADYLLVLGDAAVHFLPASELAYRQVLLLALAGKQQAAETLMQQTLKAYPGGAAGFIKDLQASTPALKQKTDFLLKMAK